MTVSIYGEEASFFRSIMTESPKWRRKEFDEWQTRAFKNYSEGKYMVAADNCLDGLTYDSDIDIVPPLKTYLTHAQVIDELLDDTTELAEHILKTNGVFGLTHLKLVAKLQHNFRQIWKKTEGGRISLKEEQQDRLIRTSKKLLSPEAGMTLFGQSLTQEQFEEMSNWIDMLFSDPTAAQDFLVNKIKASGASPETIDKTLLLIDSINSKSIKDDIDATAKKAVKTDELDEASLIAFADGINKVQKAIHACMNTGYSPELIKAWKICFSNPQIVMQFGVMELEDLHLCGKFALETYQEDQQLETLQASIYLLRNLVKISKDLNEEFEEYTNTLIIALNMLYDNNDDIEILKEIMMLGENLSN